MCVVHLLIILFATNFKSGLGENYNISVKSFYKPIMLKIGSVRNIFTFYDISDSTIGSCFGSCFVQNGVRAYKIIKERCNIVLEDSEPMMKVTFVYRVRESMNGRWQCEFKGSSNYSTTVYFRVFTTNESVQNYETKDIKQISESLVSVNITSGKGSVTLNEGKQSIEILFLEHHDSFAGTYCELHCESPSINSPNKRASTCNLSASGEIRAVINADLSQADNGTWKCKTYLSKQNASDNITSSIVVSIDVAQYTLTEEQIIIIISVVVVVVIVLVAQTTGLIYLYKKRPAIPAIVNLSMRRREETDTTGRYVKSTMAQTAETVPEIDNNTYEELKNFSKEDVPPRPPPIETMPDFSSRTPLPPRSGPIDNGSRSVPRPPKPTRMEPPGQDPWMTGFRSNPRPPKIALPELPSKRSPSSERIEKRPPLPLPHNAEYEAMDNTPLIPHPHVQLFDNTPKPHTKPIPDSPVSSLGRKPPAVPYKHKAVPGPSVPSHPIANLPMSHLASIMNQALRPTDGHVKPALALSQANLRSDNVNPSDNIKPSIKPPMKPPAQFTPPSNFAPHSNFLPPRNFPPAVRQNPANFEPDDDDEFIYEDLPAMNMYGNSIDFKNK